MLPAELGKRIRQAFQRGAGHGLLRLGAAETGALLPPVFAYWRELAGAYVTALCTRSDTEGFEVPPLQPPEERLQSLAEAAPVMPGAEYLTVEVLRNLWGEIATALGVELAESKVTLPVFLKSLNPAWNVIGRVHFNLAENKKDPQSPFAFLATYTHQLSSQGTAQHLPLGQALREYAGANRRESLLSLLLPVQRAAESCDWLKKMIDAGEIFHPLRWSVRQAFQFLHDAEVMERAGIVLRMPAVWKAGRPARPQVTATVGSRSRSSLGQDALLDFRVEITLDGEPLSEKEVAQLLENSAGLALLRGQWVEVDRQRLETMMNRYRAAERLAAKKGLSFAEAMRMLAGADITPPEESGGADPEWSKVVAGPWLADVLKRLRHPDHAGWLHPGTGLEGVLRPYQQTGMQWLHFLSELGLGACLADDMGLGKTLQVLALLLLRKKSTVHAGRSNLLVAPASLMANWAAEIRRFTPGLQAFIAHPSALSAEERRNRNAAPPADVDLVITSYGSLLRLSWLEDVEWGLVILDEAQVIKNPGAQQTRAAKKLKAQARIVLTGTPVENRLTDLWSLFDFLHPGFLGTAKQFNGYTRTLADRPGNLYGPLRDLVRPYILRRLKTDRSVIADLPEKTELKAFCSLSRKQAALYQQAVGELRERLEKVEGLQRRGTVLSFLMRFKQICNHPSQWLGDGSWEEDDSGKYARLRELCEVIAAKQEKMLLFTQFREITAPLASFLAGVFGQTGLVLHGETEVKKRQELVRQFQQEDGAPFFVLSLKAGGTGLNLTAASHVVHFDRWWNPAVENQATDRAFRIGQKKNVLVHKFICRGTFEEKIDDLIESKKKLSEELLDGSGELNVTEMNDEELLRLVALDLPAALKE